MALFALSPQTLRAVDGSFHDSPQTLRRGFFSLRKAAGILRKAAEILRKPSQRARDIYSKYKYTL